MDVALKQSIATLTASSAESAKAQPLQMGWAISKTHSGSTRFSPRVKEYLSAKFEIGERTGRKADPAQVEKDMRNARKPSNERLFNSKEWLTKSRIQSFFSRLAVSRRKERGIVGLSVEQEKDVKCLVDDAERQGFPWVSLFAARRGTPNLPVGYWRSQLLQDDSPVHGSVYITAKKRKFGSYEAVTRTFVTK